MPSWCSRLNPSLITMTDPITAQFRPVLDANGDPVMLTPEQADVIRRMIRPRSSMHERTIAELAAYHGPRLAARMAQTVQEHRAAKIRITSQHDFKPGEVVIISGLTGPNAMFNGRHVIGGGANG
jgi:hypothetical protein